MGVAVFSGVIASLDSSDSKLDQQFPPAKWESHTPGTVTPAVGHEEDDSHPSRFIACVSREESARRLKGVFLHLGGRGPSIEIRVSENVQAAQQADVVLLW